MKVTASGAGPSCLQLGCSPDLLQEPEEPVVSEARFPQLKSRTDTGLGVLGWHRGEGPWEAR